MTFDLRSGRFSRIGGVKSRRKDCICCMRGEFEFLCAGASSSAVSLCGRNTVQIRPAVGASALTFGDVKKRLEAVGQVTASEFLLRCTLGDPKGVSLTVFKDGRLMVHGVSEPKRARSIVARCLG